MAIWQNGNGAVRLAAASVTITLAAAVSAEARVIVTGTPTAAAAASSLGGLGVHVPSIYKYSARTFRATYVSKFSSMLVSFLSLLLTESL